MTKAARSGGKEFRTRVGLGTALVVAIVLIGVALLVWRLSEVLLLVFAAIILAALLRTGAEFIERISPIKSPWSLRLAIGLLLIAIVGFVYFFGNQLLVELRQLSQTLPEKVDALGQLVGLSDAWQSLSDLPDKAPQGWMMSNVRALASNTITIIGSLLVIISSGIYMAVDPHIYRKGVLLLVPMPIRPRVAIALDSAGRALQLWLLGQLGTMVLVGTAIGIGLYLIGLPSALALGLISGVLEFIPFLGPIASAIPALVLAFSSDTDKLVWVLALFVVVQQLENNLVIPLVQRRTVALPPALGIVSVIAFGLLFGWLGLFFGTPLAVVTMVLIKQLYVRDVEGEKISGPGVKGEPPKSPGK